MAGNKKNSTNSTRKARSERESTTRNKTRLLKALKISLGVVSDACDEANIDRKTYYNWLKDDPDFKLAVELINDRALDLGESALLKLVKEKNPQAVFFLLETRGKKRGYIKKQETEISGRLDVPVVSFKIPSELVDAKEEEKKTPA